MKKILLYENNHCWCVAMLYIYVDSILKEVIKINKFYDVDKDWIIIFESVGGSGYGYRPGQLKRKISLKNVEFAALPWSDDKEFNQYKEENKNVLYSFIS